MSEEKTLPKGWKGVRLGEVCKCVTGTTPSKSESKYYGNNIPFVKPPQIFDRPINTAPEKLSKIGAEMARILPVNSVLVTCIGNLGRTAINTVPVAFNQQINAIIPPSGIDGKFIFYQAQSAKFINQLNSLSAATTVPIVNKGKFETIRISYPENIPTQQAIVSKIEELFSELDNGIAQLKTAQQQLKTYRQAVLKYAFEGKEYNSTVGELFDFVGGGTPSKKEPSYWNGKIPWASVKDIKGDVLYDTEDRITKEGLENSAANLANVQDVILITRISPGKAIITNIKTAINQDLKIVKPKFKTSARFILYLFKSIERECVKLSSGTTVLGINLTNLKEISIPKIEITEQGQIVDEIERRLSVADKLQETIESTLAQSESLRQSILKQAFEGKLVRE